MTEPTDVASLPDEQLRSRYAELQRQHREVMAGRPAAKLDSDDFVAAQKQISELEVRMNEISGILAERAGRGYVAIPGRE